jgi:NADPH-dependent curcumin reductase CurA
MLAKKWILAKQFEGEPKEENIKLVEEQLPELKENGILSENFLKDSSQELNAISY